MRILVSLLVGDADDPRNSEAALATVRSLAASDAAHPTAPYHLTRYCLINGGGTDGRLAATLTRDGWVVMREPANLGIAAGRNWLLHQARADGVTWDALLELHNDMLFPPTWLRPLVDALTADAQLAVVGPALVTARGYFDTPALRVDLLREESRAAVTPALADAYARYLHKRPRLWRGLSHPCLKRHAALVVAGGPSYDDSFGPQEYEDTDEVRRLEAAGYRVAVCLDSWVYHYYCMSRLAMKRANGRRDVFYRKWEAVDGGPAATSAWLAAWEADIRKVYRL